MKIYASVTLDGVHFGKPRKVQTRNESGAASVITERGACWSSLGESKKVLVRLKAIFSKFKIDKRVFQEKRNI